MRTRTRHLLLAAGLIPALAAATQAHDPAAPVPPPAYTALPAPVSETLMGDQDWRQSNDAVGALTRGHMDVLSWEAQNMPAGAGPAHPEGEPLTPAEALRIALLNRPELFITEDVGGQGRIEADIAVIEFSRDIHRAWLIAVAAQQGLKQAEQVFESADLAIELATRMTRVGNWGQDRFLRQQLAHADAAMALALARQEATSAREVLVRKLGLWGESARITLPDSLPALPDTPVASDGLEATALRQHPRMAWLAQDAELARRGLSSRSLDAWDEAARAAVTTRLSRGEGADDPMGSLITRAPVLEYRRLPPNHQAGEAARAQARAVELAASIRSQVREAYHQYRVAHDIAQRAEANHQLSMAYQEEVLMQYNGMLKSTWELLASARDRAQRSQAAVAAQRDFWLAHANLQAVLAGADYAGADAMGVGATGNPNAGGH